MAEGRGGVAKLSFTTDLTSPIHLPPQDFPGLLSIASQKPHSCRGLALESLKNFSQTTWHRSVYCRLVRNVVELDGAAHDGPLEIELDQTRTTYLKRTGIRVMRFEHRAAFESLELVLNSIRIELDHTTPAFGHSSFC